MYMDVRHYLTRHGGDPYQDWMDALPDVRARVAILRRVDRLAAGNAGDHRYCRSGIWELRVDLGPGFRVYYAIPRPGCTLLLGAGTKRTQRADIDLAIARWNDYRSRL